MLNYEKERFFGNIVIKLSFEMNLRRGKKPVYNKLSRQILIAFLMQFRFQLFQFIVIIIIITIIIVIMITVLVIFTIILLLLSLLLLLLISMFF